ncbi:MAG TPA: hypothetical protein PLF29_03480 [bacterium]|mgnify:CR=1 FL=1|nr:hypothetical protein [bacterium]
MKITENRLEVIRTQQEYIDSFHERGGLTPSKPASMKNSVYQILCRMYLLAGELPIGTKVKIYIGDVCEDQYDLKKTVEYTISKLKQWHDVPCLFTQTAWLTFLQYEIKFVIGYDKQKEYVAQPHSIVVYRQTPDFLQKRFF